jgi:hypothetical protein
MIAMQLCWFAGVPHSVQLALPPTMLLLISAGWQLESHHRVPAPAQHLLALLERHRSMPQHHWQWWHYRACNTHEPSRNLSRTLCCLRAMD